MTFIVATNVIASRPPERRPTGTPHARAKSQPNLAEVGVGAELGNKRRLQMISQYLQTISNLFPIPLGGWLYLRWWVTILGMVGDHPCEGWWPSLGRWVTILGMVGDHPRQLAPRLLQYEPVKLLFCQNLYYSHVAQAMWSQNWKWDKDSQA